MTGCSVFNMLGSFSFITDQVNRLETALKAYLSFNPAASDNR